MLDARRLSERMAAAGVSQSELARRIGISQQGISRLLSGEVQGSKHINKIARALNTSAAYLEGETGDPSDGAIPVPTQRDVAEHLDLVSIQQIDLAYGMGGTFTDGPVEIEMLHFPRQWVESITATPAPMLTFAHGRGDSMSPTLQDGDMVIIDRSQKTVREQDSIWAITLGDIGMIKRIRVRGEVVSILSDNDRVPTDEAHHEEVNVVGRVVFIGRRT